MQECRRLAEDARKWSLPGGPYRISSRRRDAIVELAYLRGFLAWETFLEEAFILYLLGKTPPKGRTPVRYAMPPTRQAAHEMVAEGHHFAKWEVASDVSNRAERFFRDGGTFGKNLRAHQSLLENTTVIRNAVAHRSARARQRFESLVRHQLGSLPSKATVGSYLNTTVSGSTPPESFLEFYLGRMEIIGSLIVPS